MSTVSVSEKNVVQAVALQATPVVERTAAPVSIRILTASEALAAQIKRAIEVDTSCRVRKLIVEVSPGRVRLTGFCPTFYLTQLAQHAAMTIVGKRVVVTNDIEVD